MNYCIILLTILIWTTILAAECNERNPTGAVSYQTYTRIFDRAPKTMTLNKDIPAPFPVHFDKRLPYALKVPVALPIDSPVAVHLPKPYPLPLVTALPYQVEKPIPYPLKVLQPIAVNQPLAVLMKLPYTSSPNYQPYQQQPAHQQLFNQQYYH